MARGFESPLLEDSAELARFQGWSKAVYDDLLALERGSLSDADFDARYRVTRAVLVLDVTDFTKTTLHGGAISSFLRILDTHKICFPVLREHGAGFIRAFADDVVALFDDCGGALDAALEIHRRIRMHNRLPPAHDHPPECCIGVGYGPLYEIGPNKAMGDEMNRASLLGEDVARGGETLVTEGVERALAGRHRATFEPQVSDDLPFPYYRVARPTTTTASPGRSRTP